MSIKYSFIIPVMAINDYIRESVPKILEIDRDDYEIIIYPNELPQEKIEWPKTRIIPSGSSGEQRGPAYKRNLAIKDAQGEILVFLDDDAYPESNILKKLDINFQDENIVAVGGPAMTPENNSIKQKVSGAVFLSPLSGGCPERYVPVGKKRFIDDIPSVNLSVYKKAYALVNGFDNQYWPGEDTKLCLDLIEKTGKKILYDPDVRVYHHRREGLLRHLKQVSGYGLHRGFFAKKFPKTSLKFKYFPPTLFLFFIPVGLALSFAHPWLMYLYILGWVIYAGAIIKALADIRKYEKEPVVLWHSIYYIFLTHLVYGWRFLVGFLFTKELKSKMR